MNFLSEHDIVHFLRLLLCSITIPKPLSVCASFKNGQFYDLFARTVRNYDLVKFAERRGRRGKVVLFRYFSTIW